MSTKDVLPTPPPEPPSATPREETDRRPSRFAIFPAFQLPAYRRYLLSFGAANFGLQNQEVVRAWVAYNLHGSAADSGLVILLSAVGQAIGAPLGGVVADRFDRKRIIITMQAILLIVSALAGILVILDVIQLWHLMMLSFVTGIAGSMHMPARQSLIYNIVGPKYIANAAAMSNGLMSMMRLIGPAVAGLLIAVAGDGPAYFSSVAAFVISMVTLRIVTESHTPRITPTRESPLRSLVEGAKYIYRRRPLFWLYVLSAGVIMMGAPFRENMSPFAIEELEGGPGTYGNLLSLLGLGALGGSVILAATSGSKNKGSMLIISGLVWGAMILVFSQVPSLPVAVPVLLILGSAQAISFTILSIVIQGTVDDAYRGRLLSFHLLSFSAAGFTGLAIGHVVDWAGVRTTFLGMGVVIVTFVLFMALWRKDIRRLG